MVYCLIESIVYWLNSFPSKGGASQTLSPASIVTGRNYPDFNNKFIQFGAYAWAYIRTTNTMKARRVPCIALGPSNEWGGQYFMSLYTGKKLHSYDWVESPIDDDVIARVEELAEMEDQPNIIDNMPIFEWGVGNQIIDEVESTIHASNDDVGPTMVYTPVFDSLHNLNNTPTIEETATNTIPLGTEESSQPIGDAQDELGQDPDNIPEEEGIAPVGVSEVFDDDVDLSNQSIVDAYTETEERLDHELQEISDLIEGMGSTVIQNDTTPEHTEGLRRSNRRNAGTGVDTLIMDHGGKDYRAYKHRTFLQQKKREHTKRAVTLTMIKRRSMFMGNKQEMMNKALGIILAHQMSAKKGITKFGERAVAALVKEFTQLDQGAFPGKPVVEPVEANLLTTNDKARALEAMNIIAEKRCGKIKGRTCADGSKQRRYLKDDESVASPTVCLESLLSTLLIITYEERHVSVFDVLGAYLHAKMPYDKTVIMKLRGEFVDIMCQANEKYKHYITYENGKKVLYLRVLRAIYGCIKSALLWYDLFLTTLQNMGFIINPYDRCVANKMIN